MAEDEKLSSKSATTLFSFLRPKSDEETGENHDTISRKKLKQQGRDVAKRCVALIDLDAFFVAVERMLDPTLVGVPVGVAQYTKSDTLIAISYEAKAAGVKRGMFGFQAKKVCPELRIVKVETKNEKADLTKYRDASAKVLAIATRYCASIERASVDEFYLDLSEEAKKRLEQWKCEGKDIKWADTTLFCTEYDKVAECPESLKLTEEELANGDSLLAAGTNVVYDIRMAIKTELGLDCSAGIATNRFLAKSIAGIRKPATQIALKQSFVEPLCKTMPVQKARSLGGKLGETLKNEFGIEFLGDLKSQIGEARLCQIFGEKEGKRLFQLSMGNDDTPVVPRVLAKSIGCSKQFPGKQALMTRQQVSDWLSNLCTEAAERVEKDGRRPTTMTVGAYRCGSRSISNANFAKITRESLLTIAESLFDRLMEPEEIERRGGIHGLYLNLTGFPDVEEDERASNQTKSVSKWTCSMCTCENDPKWLRCEACGAHKWGFNDPSSLSATAKQKASPLKSHNSSSSLFFINKEDESSLKLEKDEIVPEDDVEVKQKASSSSSPIEIVELEDSNDEMTVEQVTTLSSDHKQSQAITTTTTTLEEEEQQQQYNGNKAWTCKTCTYAGNDVRFLRCEMCDALR